MKTYGPNLTWICVLFVPQSIVSLIVEARVFPVPIIVLLPSETLGALSSCLGAAGGQQRPPLTRPELPGQPPLP